MSQPNLPFQQLTQLYAALTHCNQAIVRCTSQEELLREACRVVVEYGGMSMAWVGLVDAEGKRVIPLTAFGEGTKMLEGIHITTDPKDPYGQGPSGTTVRENQPFWCEDFTNDPRLAPWHERVAKYGWRATVTVPICRNGKAIGAFSMYTDHPRDFDEAARNLMIRIGQDISHALDNYALEAERRRNEEILRGESLESLSQRDNALKEITQGVLIANADRVATYINPAFTARTGYTPEEVIGQRCTLLHGPETNTELIAEIRALLETNKPFQGEILNYRKDGTPFWNDLTITPVFDNTGKLVQWVGVQRDVTDRKQAHARIERLNRLYSALSHCSNAIVHCANKKELFDRICDGAVQYGRMKMAWIGLIDKGSRTVVPAASYGSGVEYLNEFKLELEPASQAQRAHTATALVTNQPVWCQDFWAETVGLPWHETSKSMGFRAAAALPLRMNGEVIGTFTLYADAINAFDEEARSLLLEMAQDIGFALENFDRKAQLQLSANVIEQSNEAIVIADKDRHIVMLNKAFTAMSGYTIDEVRGKTFRVLFAGYKSDESFKTIIEAIDRIGHWQGEIWNHRKNGELYLEWLSVSQVHDADGNRTHYVCISSDITKRKQDEERMHWLAHFDPLTGLPNRTLLEDRCKQAISMAQNRNEPLALMFLNLDHFKNINDSIGHRIGDQLLVDLANRLTFIAREQDTVSRMSGDDFVLAIPGIDASATAHLAEKVLAAVSHPFNIEGQELSITGSIGVAMYPIDGADFDTLIKHADVAKYRAKELGRNTFCFFTPEIHSSSMRALQLENALRRALERNQLSLHYQPQVSLKTGKIVGAEALLRWQHPDFGTISPGEFIPLAENSGLILPIGEWVMRTAARQTKVWLDAGYPPFTISVNLSPLQFRSPRLIELVMEVLAEAGLPPDHFELELTESAAMENPKAAIAVMEGLHGCGIRLSIDDFGTGYSSLAHLKRFKVHKLKIDRSFVTDLLTDSDDKAIVDAVIKLACSLGLKTIAEGVEDEAQMNLLRQLGCNEMQGYYFSRPLPAKAFEALLRDSFG